MEVENTIFKPVTHVIFDLDGLLLDSETCYKQMYDDMVGQYGKEYTWDVNVKVMGTVETDTARIMVEELQLPITPEEFLSQQRSKEKRYLANIKLMPGAERLLRHLKQHNIPFAVATSGSSESVEIKSTNHRELFSMFRHVVCGTSDPEVKHGKPAPDIFLICASRFPDKPKPEKCLVFEDAPNGVAAGSAAGMQVVMVPDPKVPNEKRLKATVVLSSLEEFKPELFGLPPF